MALSTPDHLTLRAYQVGFGDCFLLTFRYKPPGRDRNVLIDFGSTGSPKVYGSDLLNRVAEDIRKECNEKLDIVIATHRHRDHIDGFATAPNGTGTGDIIRRCRPEIVLQPWTEDPDAATDAKVPTQKLPPTNAYVRALSSMQGFSNSLLTEMDFLRGKIGKTVQRELSFLGENNLKNASAVKNLMTMGKHKPMYLYFGAAVDTSRLLPGVVLHVLGPPTIEQSDTIRKQRARDEAEFWHFQATTSKTYVTGHKTAFRGRASRIRPPYTRWIIPKLQASRGEQMLELVRMLDKAMNNTSLILLFEVGTKKFLFPGDAQIENWSYALDQAKKRPKLRKLLGEVDFYKVGHHGSLNATPKSLWNLFKRRDGKKSKGRLQTVMSTMAEKHGNRDRGTEVPRKKLVEALEHESDFYSTQALKKKSELKKVFEISI
jgi:hypothetical protein